LNTRCKNTTLFSVKWLIEMLITLMEKWY